MAWVKLQSILLDILRGLIAPQFLVCALLLGGAAAGLTATARKLGVWFQKHPLPLKRPLSELDKEALAPYRFLRSQLIKAEMLDSLGTKEYIQWLLEDPGVPANDPRRVMVLFVTYYTGMRDPVPHVPEVCYLGGGFKRQASRAEMVRIEELHADIALRATTFLRSGMASRQETTVIYTFNSNGSFTPDRERVRVWMSNPFEKYGYYSKVEVTCAGGDRGAGPEKAIEAAKKLLQEALPLLVRDHWPDWEQETGKASRSGELAGSAGLWLEPPRRSRVGQT